MIKKLTLIFLLITPLSLFAAPGIYVQAQGGWTTNTGLGEGLIDINTIATGRLSTGYLWGDNNFNYGLETGASYYRGSNHSNWLNQDVTLDGYIVDLLGVVKYTFDSGFNVYGKAGGAYVTRTLDQTTTTNGVTTSSNGTTSALSPEVDLGVGYQFTPAWGVNLTGIAIFDPPQPLNHMAGFLFGVSYKFS